MRKVQPRYRVVRTLGGPEYADVALVREVPIRKRHRWGRSSSGEATVLYHRVFRPADELDALEAYAAQLEAAAKHGNDGTLWHFVTTRAHRNGTVEVSLFDRWFDGNHMRCERRAHQEFDAAQELSVVPSVEFAASLQVWAERRNEERAQRLQETNAAEEPATDRSVETAAAAAELASLLSSITGRT